MSQTSLGSLGEGLLPAGAPPLAKPSGCFTGHHQPTGGGSFPKPGGLPWTTGSLSSPSPGFLQRSLCEAGGVPREAGAHSSSFSRPQEGAGGLPEDAEKEVGLGLSWGGGLEAPRCKPGSHLPPLPAPAGECGFSQLMAEGWWACWERWTPGSSSKLCVLERIISALWVVCKMCST